MAANDNKKFLYSIVLTSLIFPLIEATEEQYHLVKIGGIFYKGEKDLMKAFDTAVQDINTLGKKFELEPITRILAEDDSIVLQQITCELLDDGVSAIFGPSSNTTTTDIVAVLCNMTGIPHFLFDWRGDETDMYHGNYQYTVNVAPSEHVLSTALLSIVKKYEWKSFTILYEASSDLSRMQYLLSWKDFHKGGIKMVKFNRDSDYRVLWKIIQNSRERNILLECPHDILLQVANASIYFNMTGPFNSFIFSNMDTHLSGMEELYSESFSAKVNAIRLRSYIPAPVHSEMDVFAEKEEDAIISLRTQCLYDSVILYFNAIVQLYEYRPPPAPPREPFEQPRVSCRQSGYWPQGRDVMEKVKNMDHKLVVPNYKTQRLILNSVGIRDDFNLDVYNPVIERINYVWNKYRGLVPFEEIAENTTQQAKKKKVETKEDFSMKKPTYNVATRFGSPFFMMREEPEGTHYEGNERFCGYVVDLIYELAKECNFEFIFQPVSDNAYGSQDPKTLEWNGIIRDLMDNKAQLGICDLTITHERKKVVDFTVPFMQLGVGILYQKPKPPEKNLFGFFKVYSLDSWLSLGAAIMVMSTLHYLVARLCLIEWEVDPLDPDPAVATNIWTMRNTINFYINCAMNCGCPYLPRGGSMRIFVTFWWIFSFLMCQNYIANMTSHITVSKMDGTIKSLEDLVDQNKIQFGTIKGGATAMLFSESNNPEHTTAWSKMTAFKPDAFTKNNDEGVDRVKRSKGGYAFLLETPTLKYHIERNCELTSIGEPFGEKHYGIAVPQNADYRANLSIGLLRLGEKGELYKLKKLWFHSNDTDCDLSHPQKNGDSDRVDMDTIGGAFMILVAGLLLSLFIAIGEFLWHVNKIVVNKKVPRKVALKSEFKFFLRFWLDRKPLAPYKCEEAEITDKEKRKKGKRKKGGGRKALCITC